MIISNGGLFFSIVDFVDFSLLFLSFSSFVSLFARDCNYPDYDFVVVVVGGNTIATPRLQVIAQNGDL